MSIREMNAFLSSFDTISKFASRKKVHFFPVAESNFVMLASNLRHRVRMVILYLQKMFCVLNFSPAVVEYVSISYVCI